jgi:hypothetical protein
MEWWHWLILVVANSPVFFGIGWVIFDSWEGFGESLYYWIRPDMWSWIQGDGVEDWWAELKLVFFLIVCGACVWGEYALIDAYLLGP